MVGFIITGSGDEVMEYLGESRRWDMGFGFCGHITFIVDGSPTADTNNIAKARVGDAVAGCIIGVMITGAGTGLTG